LFLEYGDLEVDGGYFREGKIEERRKKIMCVGYIIRSGRTT